MNTLLFTPMIDLSPPSPIIFDDHVYNMLSRVELNILLRISITLPHSKCHIAEHLLRAGLTHASQTY